MSIVNSSDGLSSTISTTTKDENANGRDTAHKHSGNKSIQAPQGNNKPPTKRCKLVIVGDGCCGKTSLLTVFKRYEGPFHE